MTVHDRFATTAQRYPELPYLHIPRQACREYSDRDITLSYAGAAVAVEALTSAWRAAGYGPGHTVALALDNRKEFFLHFLALNRLGVCVVPLNGEATVAELAHVIATGKATVALVLQERHARVLDAAAAGQGCHVLEISAFPALPAPPPAPDPGIPDGATPAAIIFTSGTTARPKGCLLSNDFFLYTGEWYVALGGRCSLTPGVERIITPLPVFHTNALVFSHMAAIETGGCVVQLDRFHPASWWETVRESRATIVHYLGVMPAMLMGLAADPAQDRNHSLRFGFGAGVDPAQHAPFEARFGFPLIEGWAMTETGAAVCFMDAYEPRRVGTRCIGHPPAYMECRIVDDEGRDVAVGREGEFLVRRAGADPRRYFYSGYIGDAAATDKAWAGGWFHTGDVMRCDDAGFVYFVERRKNIIRRSGENIAAAEVESVLLRHPAVANCAVAPVPDEVRGEEVAACVVVESQPGAGPDLAMELLRHCRMELSYYKLPGWITFVRELPVTSTQKLQRGALKELIANQMQAGRVYDFRSLKRRGGSRATDA